MHADHHGGLYPLLELRAQLGEPPLLVIGPPKLFTVLQGYQAVVSARGYACLANLGQARMSGLSRCTVPCMQRKVEKCAACADCSPVPHLQVPLPCHFLPNDFFLKDSGMPRAPPMLVLQMYHQVRNLVPHVGL